MASESITPDSVLSYPLDARFRNFRGVLIVSRDEAVFELSDSAGFIARQVDGCRSVHDMGRLLADKYDIDITQAVEDTLELLEELVRHGILVVEDRLGAGDDFPSDAKVTAGRGS